MNIIKLCDECGYPSYWSTWVISTLLAISNTRKKTLKKWTSDNQEIDALIQEVQLTLNTTFRVNY